MKNMQKGIDYIGVGVTYFCHDGQGNVLMSFRGPKARDEHFKWDIGGGGLKHGETLVDALKRELAEEYLTEPVEIELLGFRQVHRVHNGVKTHWINFDHKVRIDPKKFGNGEPNVLEEVKWFKFEEMPENLHSQVPNFLNLYKDRLF
ncbi:NUDIX domain-containing protein [Candidatus Peregrinibacteria bacterium]|nr:NUDIX domain-containing protein [Candidatus Peregrinibacteria bacterium]